MSDRIEEIKARCEAGTAIALSLRDLDDIKGQKTIRSTAADIISGCYEDIFYLIGEIDRLKMMFDAEATGKETMQRKMVERNENLRLDYLDAIAERDAAVAQNKYIKTLLIELQGILTLFSEGKTTEAMLKSLVLLGEMRGVQK